LEAPHVLHLPQERNWWSFIGSAINYRVGKPDVLGFVAKKIGVL